MNISFGSDSGGILSLSAHRKQFGIGSLLALIAFGSIFTGAGFAIHKTTQVNPLWTKIPGTITNVSSHQNSKGSTTYTPTVNYIVDDKVYSITSSFSSSSQPIVGHTQQVAYNPSNPDQAKVVEGMGVKWFIYLLPAIGLGIIGIAIFAYMRSHKRTVAIKRLLREGYKLQGIVTDIQSRNGNSSSVYNLIVTAVNPSGQTQTYISDSIMGIGGLAMADFRTHPVPIDVYISQVNPSDYYVDVSHLPSLSPERIKELLTSASNPPATIRTPQSTISTPPNQQPPNTFA